MKKVILSLSLCVSFIFLHQDATAQNWGKIFDRVAKSGNGTTTGGTSSLSNTEIVNGLKEALQIGTKNSSQKLSATNGFFGNALLKILLPPEARQAEQTLRGLGMGNIVDKAILTMNRAAEDAAGQVVPIFVNSITSMTITDGINILRGGQGSATNFLKGATTAALTSAFRPIIDRSLSKTGATAYYGDVVRLYNRLPQVRNKINPDLTAYVTERALSGLFITIADEENQIRNNPAARVTDLLQKVFGNKG